MIALVGCPVHRPAVNHIVDSSFDSNAGELIRILADWYGQLTRLEIGSNIGGPTGNRTQMLGLEDPIGAIRHCSAAAGGCRCREGAHVNWSVVCRPVSCFVVGAGGKTGGIPSVGSILYLLDIVSGFRSSD